MSRKSRFRYHLSSSTKPKVQCTCLVIAGDKSQVHSSSVGRGQCNGPSMRRPVGVKSILFSRRGTSLFFSPSSHCRHASIRTLEERLVSLGACWASSIQPVLPSVWRPVVLLLKSGTRARPLTQSPELGFGFCLFSSWNDFDLVLRFAFYAAAATIVICLCRPIG